MTDKTPTQLSFTKEQLAAGWDNRGELPPSQPAGPPKIVRWSYGPPPLSSLIVESPAAYVRESRYRSAIAARAAVFWKRVMLGLPWIELLDERRRLVARYIHGRKE